MQAESAFQEQSYRDSMVTLKDCLNCIHAFALQDSSQIKEGWNHFNNGLSL